MLSLAESSLHHEAEGLLSSDPLLKSVVACIPAYNEEIAIGSVVLRARRFVDRVVVIDDCSTDATAEVARLAGADVLHMEGTLAMEEP